MDWSELCISFFVRWSMVFQYSFLWVESILCFAAIIETATHTKDGSHKNNKTKETRERCKRKEIDCIPSGTHTEIGCYLLLPLINNHNSCRHTSLCRERCNDDCVRLACSMNSYTKNSSRYLNFKSIACDYLFLVIIISWLCVCGAC